MDNPLFSEVTLVYTANLRSIFDAGEIFEQEVKHFLHHLPADYALPGAWEWGWDDGMWDASYGKEGANRAEMLAKFPGFCDEGIRLYRFQYLSDKREVFAFAGICYDPERGKVYFQYGIEPDEEGMEVFERVVKEMGLSPDARPNDQYKVIYRPEQVVDLLGLNKDSLTPMMSDLIAMWTKFRDLALKSANTPGEGKRGKRVPDSAR